MCGIIGYTGHHKKAKEIAIGCLKNLEYRGYDSSGIALFEDATLSIFKAKGKIVNLEERVKENSIQASSAIAHTRWATHGIPNETNAHPHYHGDVALVHNGIIENYAEIKEKLEQANITLQTETDTEIACAYLNLLYQQNKENTTNDTLYKIQTIAQACQAFRGSYAFGILFADEPDVIYATRHDSPLIIGKGIDGNFIASDISAILDYTKEYMLLKHEEIARITKDSIQVYNSNLTLVEKEIKTADWDSTKYQKNGFEHFMLKEIHEQPEVIDHIYHYYLDEDTPLFDFTPYHNIHIVACGSAMHAGLVGKYLLENYANIETSVEVASEYRYKHQMIGKETLVIIISQSGETADSIAALRIAKEKGAYTLGIVNGVGSTIARECDKTLYTYAGPEIAVATTKGYTTQVALLSLLTLEAMKQRHLLTDDMNIRNDFSHIKTILENTIDREEEYIKIAKAIYEKEHLFYIGRGIDSALCMEGSLKLKEISYMHSESYSAGELKHGTISLIENGTPVIAIATNEQLYEKTVSNVIETKSRGAYIIFITTDQAEENHFADITLRLPKTTEFVQGLVVVTALQLIAYETAKLRHCDIDKPKNLAKSVTVE